MLPSPSWVGYDNADRKRRSLGSSETGASVALPIFEPNVEAVWARKIAPKVPLSGPSPEAQRRLCRRSDPITRAVTVCRGSHGFVEHFRLRSSITKFTTRSIKWFPANRRTMSAGAKARR